MRSTLSIIGITAALVMCAVSGVMNYLFMASLGKTPLEGYVLGAASVAADVIKALLPFFIAWSWAEKRMVAAVSGTLALVFFAGFSLLSAVGFAADNRGTLVESRESKTQAYSRVQSRLADADARRSDLPAHRPAAVVTEEIGAHRQNRRWQATEECTNATEPESRAFCAEHFRLRAELATANESDRLAEQITSLQSESETLRQSGGAHGVDPQVSLLSRITGQQPEPVRLALTIAVALLVEIGVSLGLFLASGHHIHAALAIAASPVANPAGCVEDFCMEALVPSKTSSLDQSALFGGYQTWCARDNRPPLEPEAFTAAFTALADAVGIPRKAGGWSGIALKHDKAALDMVS